MAKKIVDATLQYQNGRYAESRQQWESVLTLNGNCETAYIGLGWWNTTIKIMQQAAAYFKLGQDRQNYSKAFSKYRSQVIVDHFGEIAAVLLALAGALLVLAICLRLRRKYREIVDSVMHARRR